MKNQRQLYENAAKNAAKNAKDAAKIAESLVDEIKKENAALEEMNEKLRNELQQLKSQISYCPHESNENDPLSACVQCTFPPLQ